MLPSMMGTFRWDLSRREQLGRLIDGRQVTPEPWLVEELVVCCGGVLSLCDDSDLCFVGRSPESVFDLLSGALYRTSWKGRLTLLNLSMRSEDTADVRVRNPGRVEALRPELTALGLDPTALTKRSRPVALVDLVATGGTLGNVVDLLLTWGKEVRADIEALKRKLRFVGITWRTKNSPKTWRWQQQVPWMRRFPQRAARNVSISGRLWDHLGNRQPKVMCSYPSWRWGDPELRQPPHWERNLEALAHAVALHDKGRTEQQRRALARVMAGRSEIRQRWLRSLVSELAR